MVVVVMVVVTPSNMVVVMATVVVEDEAQWPSEMSACGMFRLGLLYFVLMVDELPWKWKPPGSGW